MGVMLFLKICLIVLLSTISVRALDNKRIADKTEAFQVAGCIARCERDFGLQKVCRRKCLESSSRRVNATVFGDVGTRFSGRANFNATLHCKDTDVIKIRHNPGIWVIEESDSDEDSWKNGSRIQVNDKTTSTFRNLTAGTSYRYKAHRIMPNGVISEPEVSPWFTTFEMGHRPQEVSDVKIANQSLDDGNPSRLRADIIFKPASDRSCRYDVVSWNEDEGLTIAEFESAQDFHFSLSNLDYEKNVTVFVSARISDHSQTSDNASLTFVTSSCLQMHRSLTFCAPDQVKGLRVSGAHENGSNCEILVTWDQPDFVPDSYSLQFQYLEYDQNEALPLLITVPGNLTEALLSVEGSDIDYRQRIISIIAESPGGASAQTWIYVNLEEILNNLTAKSTTATVKNTSFKDGIVAISSVGIFMFVAGIAYAYHLRRHRNRTSNDKKAYKYSQNLNGGGKELDRSSYGMGKEMGMEFENKYPLIPRDEFEIHPIQLTIKDVLLGSGAYGIVRFGRFQSAKNQAIDVAVKTLKDDANLEDLKNFRQEISIMKSAGHHPNIVSIIGCCTLDMRRPMLVVEYCSRGDLQTYLRVLWQEIMSQALERRARCKVGIEDNAERANEANKVESTMNVTSWIVAHQVAIANKMYDMQEECIVAPKDEKEVIVRDLLKFAREVAYGMEFLSLNRIIHRDLAARNVLVCADKTVKISDFGLSRDIYQENVYKKQGNGRLPLKWMAIEALTHQIYTTKSDVWSFGILLWEIVTLGANPYPDTPTNMVLQLLKSGYRMKKPENCGNELYDIMRACWHSRPRSRPNFTQLKTQLDRLSRIASGDENVNILREPANSCNTKKLVNNHYSNIYSK